MTEIYYRDETSRAEVDVQTAPIEALARLYYFLQTEELQAEIAQGNITLAMIRPNLEPATNLEGTDVDIAEAIEEDIYHLGVKAKFAIKFDEPTVNEFYGGPRESMLKKPSEYFDQFPNRWAEFADLMLAGPTTVLLLHSPTGDAIELWRQQVGHWDIVNRRDPATLRGKFGLDSHNNLVHGSDSPAAVSRELAVISEYLKRQVVGSEQHPRV